MKVSFDGLRIHLVDQFNILIAEFEESKKSNNLMITEDNLNDLRNSVAGLICCYDDSDKEDCNNLSHLTLAEITDEVK